MNKKIQAFVFIIFLIITCLGFFYFRGLADMIPIKITGIITETDLFSVNKGECYYFIVDNKYRIDTFCEDGPTHFNKKLGAYESDNFNKFIGFGSGGINKDYIGKKVEVYGENLGKDWFFLDRVKEFNLIRLSLNWDDNYVKLIK